MQDFNVLSTLGDQYILHSCSLCNILNRSFTFLHLNNNNHFVSKRLQFMVFPLLRNHSVHPWKKKHLVWLSYSVSGANQNLEINRSRNIKNTFPLYILHMLTNGSNLFSELFIHLCQCHRWACYWSLLTCEGSIDELISGP